MTIFKAILAILWPIVGVTQAFLAEPEMFFHMLMNLLTTGKI